jgi:hypothetical protein
MGHINRRRARMYEESGTLDMDSAKAYEVIRGVIAVIDDEAHDVGAQKLYACMAALDRVAEWLDVISEAEGTLKDS